MRYHSSAASWNWRTAYSSVDRHDDGTTLTRVEPASWDHPFASNGTTGVSLAGLLDYWSDRFTSIDVEEVR